MEQQPRQRDARQVGADIAVGGCDRRPRRHMSVGRHMHRQTVEQHCFPLRCPSLRCVLVRAHVEIEVLV
eukprot:2224440-Rhodomonas_salina.3